MGRFKHLVDSEEGMKSFRTKDNILPHVGVRYTAQGEYFDERKISRLYSKRTHPLLDSHLAVERGGQESHQN